ncbi:MAG TPA: sensor domain-containing diguanylate cyclase [Smithella sp.]|nr:GGDEF domain-containing protein [Smithella sp.]MDM7988274.1 sensor domain-containing diguanylate cyclase [Smithella sp.]HNY51244.1 sensor domain-containing diguanylate cyclase [Smithella sp.]HOG91346.1 sensor domain-containing diguanylate cyclase [Smithella sp.]HOU52131.1 sensor domain-containing diguanylate cyclase [Smithella sp.]
MVKGYKTRLQLIDELKEARREIQDMQLNAQKSEQLEKELTRSRLFYQTLFENSGTATIVIEQDTTISMFNNDFANFTGYDRDEIIGHSWTKFVAEDDIVRLLSFHRARRQESSSAPRNYEFKIRNKNGNLLNIFMTITIIPETTQSVASMVDITERVKVEKELQKSERRYLELSILDDLTQLYNSRHFYAQLEKEMERSKRYEQPLTLLMLDLDKFKDFNDTYGHIEGDYVLSRLGQVIKRCLRDSDSAYRYGGEEFTVMLPVTTSQDGFVIAQRIQNELSHEIFTPVSGEKVALTMSIGISQYNPHDDVKAFVNRADHFMYQAKHDGRNRICLES